MTLTDRLFGQHTAETGCVAAELRLTPDDLWQLLAEARRRRGQGAPARRPQVGGPGYQARLRAVGWLAEVAGLRGLRVVEAGEDLVLEGRTAEASVVGDRRVVRKRLTPADIAALLQQLRGL